MTIADMPLKEKLTLSLDILDLSSRSTNALERAGVETLGDLVKHKEHELSRIKNFGDTSLYFVKANLDKIGLRLGMSRETSSALPRTYGLTKRELFAAMAMQGALGNAVSIPRLAERSASAEAAHRELADNAVKSADALIEALNKEQP